MTARTDTPRDLGSTFDVRAMNIGDRIEVRGLEPRLVRGYPTTIGVGERGCATLFRSSGVVVFFGVEVAEQQRFVDALGERLQGRYEQPELESATVRLGGEDGVEPDALVLKECTVERLQVIAEVLTKSVVLARNERSIWRAFRDIEPQALAMKQGPWRLPWKQRELVRQIGAAMIVEHQLVDRAEVLEKPELLWDRPDLDRLYARLEDEYEIRERHAVLERKLSAVSNAARTMLELTQVRRSHHLELWIVGLIVFEILLTLQERLF